MYIPKIKAINPNKYDIQPVSAWQNLFPVGETFLSSLLLYAARIPLKTLKNMKIKPKRPTIECQDLKCGWPFLFLSTMITMKPARAKDTETVSKMPCQRHLALIDKVAEKILSSDIISMASVRKKAHWN